MYNLWRRWTLNCAIGELLGIACAGIIAFTMNIVVGEPVALGYKLLILSAMMLAGFFEGVVLSYFQWKVLVTKFTRIPRNEWLLYTVVVAVLGWFLGMIPSLFLSPTTDNNDGVVATLALPNPFILLIISLGSGLFLGTIFGLFQWFSLRKYAHKAYLWIIANALGWGLGLGWIYLFASIPTEDSNIWFIVIVGIIGGILTGLSVGGVTGYFLIMLEVNHTNQDPIISKNKLT